MTTRTRGEHEHGRDVDRPHHFSFCRGRVWLAVAALHLFAPQVLAAGWVGRSLQDVLAEQRAAGVTLIYSGQVVKPDLTVSIEPTATHPVERLRQVLEPLGLQLQPLPQNVGFAIVRADAPRENLRARVVAAAELAEVHVYASRYNVVREDEDSIAMSRSALQTMTGSEQDVLRALRFFPGTANNGVSALAHVRGGNEDETLVQFDGVELYNPVHLKDFQGLFGLLDGEFVQSLRFFSGGFPVRYGNHTSGMVDIAPRRSREPANLLGVSMLYTRAMSTGSFEDERGTWLLGYRNSSLPEVLDHLRRKIGDPAFEDFVGRASYEWRGTKFTVGTLRLNDDLRLFTGAHAEQTSAHYRDTYLWVRGERAFGERFLAHLQISNADLTSERIAEVDVNLINSGSLTRTRATDVTSALLDFTAYLLESTAVDFGGRIDHGKLRYDYATQTTALDPLARVFRVPHSTSVHLAGDPSGDLYSAYVSARHTHGRLSAVVGIRWDDYDYINHTDTFSPRVNVSYALDAANDVRLSAGRFVQARTPNNLDITSLVPRFSRPESSEQYVLAFDHRFDVPLNLHVEAYTKHNEHVRQYSENTLDIVTLAPELKIDRILVAPQSASARGLEISLVSTRSAPLNWWLNYTWSRTRDRFRTREFPRSFDQPHALAMGLSWTTARWQTSGAFTWHTGWPYTPLNVTTTASGDAATLGERNSQRFGNFASLDLRTQYQLPIGKTAVDMFLEIHNVFNRGNDCCRQIKVTETPDGDTQIRVKQKSWLGMVPLAGIDWRF